MAERQFQASTLHPPPRITLESEERLTKSGPLNNRGDILLSALKSSTSTTYFLIADNELKELPQARLGDRTRYCDLNDHGWLAGWVEFVDPESDSLRVRGFVARPFGIGAR